MIESELMVPEPCPDVRRRRRPMVRSMATMPRQRWVGWAARQGAALTSMNVDDAEATAAAARLKWWRGHGRG